MRLNIQSFRLRGIRPAKLRTAVDRARRRVRGEFGCSFYLLTKGMWRGEVEWRCYDSLGNLTVLASGQPFETPEKLRNWYTR